MDMTFHSYTTSTQTQRCCGMTTLQTQTHTQSIPETNALCSLVKSRQVMRHNKHVRLTRWSNKAVLQLFC